jgi:lipopolysaccharide/colanic/teichoic acid biosynthesis glycosyltransferase
VTRLLDISFSFIGLLLLSPILFILLVIGCFDTGSPIFQQQRVGRGKKPFRLYKFLSMYLNAPSVATHLVSASSITPFGNFLRKSKLDELPQLWNVLIGEQKVPKNFKALHYTKGGPYFKKYRNCEQAKFWFLNKKEMEAGLEK